MKCEEGRNISGGIKYFLDKTVKWKLKDGVEKMDLKFTEKNCRGCHVTLSEFESNEYKTLCIDCYREENEIVSKTKARTLVRTKGKRFILSA
ncbi:hypothetical protein [Ammoniphilus sp. 3BR4]|uniref:hypothetical protein n=1 Tax=Ammoniphilus sp. 3BR4 TaxID=3158265 RepID=UPI0034663163